MKYAFYITLRAINVQISFIEWIKTTFIPVISDLLKKKTKNSEAAV